MRGRQDPFKSRSNSPRTPTSCMQHFSRFISRAVRNSVGWCRLSRPTMSVHFPGTLSPQNRCQHAPSHFVRVRLSVVSGEGKKRALGVASFFCIFIVFRCPAPPLPHDIQRHTSPASAPTRPFNHTNQNLPTDIGPWCAHFQEVPKTKKSSI
jgi:hypothetical protein